METFQTDDRGKARVVRNTSDYDDHDDDNDEDSLYLCVSECVYESDRTKTSSWWLNDSHTLTERF